MKKKKYEIICSVIFSWHNLWGFIFWENPHKH